MVGSKISLIKTPCVCELGSNGLVAGSGCWKKQAFLGNGALSGYIYQQLQADFIGKFTAFLMSYHIHGVAKVVLRSIRAFKYWPGVLSWVAGSQVVRTIDHQGI